MKKYLFLFVLIALWHPPAAHAIALSGAGCSAVNAGAGTSVSCSTPNVAGRAQIVAVKWCDDSGCATDTSSDTYTLTDTSSNTYGQCQRLDSASGTDRRGMAVCIAQAIGASASDTVTFAVTSSNTVQLAGLIVSEVSGVTNSVTVDQHGTTDLAANPSPVTVSTGGATVQGNELIYTWVNIDTGTLAVGQPVIGAMGTNYANRQLGTPVNVGGGTAAMDEWANASPRATVKTETMSFNALGFTLNPQQQERGIIVTYLSPVNEAPQALTFPNQVVSTTSSAQTITITNTGTSNLNLRNNPTLSGSNASDFSVGAGTCVNGANIAAGASCTILLTFTPSAAGTRTASVSMNSNAAGSPHVATISGVGFLLNGQVKTTTGHP